MRLGKRVRNTELRQNDDGAMHGGSLPIYMRMPPKSSSLPHEGKIVNIALTGLNRALCDISRPVRPPGPQLPNAMPKMKIAKGF